MRFTKTPVLKLSAIVVALLAMTLLVVKPGFDASAKSAAGPTLICPDCTTCFPSCAVGDSRMMSLSGGGLQSFVGGTLEVGFSSGQNSITIGVFDADSIGPQAGGLWDQATANLKFEVFADPSGTGTPTTKLDSFLSTDAGAVNNDWWDHTYSIATPNFDDAKTKGGDFSFVFRISLDGMPAPGTINGFKLRTNRELSLKGQTVQFIAKASFAPERVVVYPGLAPGTCPAANQPTTYDGTWEIPFNVPQGTKRLELWDGDMDFGSADGTTKDSDDPNTPSAGVCVATGGTAAQCAGNPDIPLWAQGTAAVAEGVAGVGGKGEPPDDNTSVPFGCLVTRLPSVKYRLVPPSGEANAFINNNPSGTGEWEKFLVSSDPADVDADHKPAAIEPGAWKLRIEGLDLFNQFTMHFTFNLGPPPGGKHINFDGSMEGHIDISPGDWVSGGFHFHLDKRNPGPVKVTFGNTTMTLPVDCSHNAGKLPAGTFNIVIPIGTITWTQPANSTSWILTGDQQNIDTWQKAIQAPDLCNGGKMHLLGGGAIFDSVVTADPHIGNVQMQFHYRIPAAKGKPNTDCTNAGDPNRAKADVCGASWSSTVDP